MNSLFVVPTQIHISNLKYTIHLNAPYLYRIKISKITEINLFLIRN